MSDRAENPTHFACADCHLICQGQDEMHAQCPECGNKYEGFFTRLIRTSDFAYAYWLESSGAEPRVYGRESP